MNSNKETFEGSRYYNQAGCAEYLTPDEFYGIPLDFEQTTLLYQNMNYDLTRDSRDWRVNQRVPDYLSPQLLPIDWLKTKPEQNVVPTMRPRPTLTNWRCNPDFTSPYCGDYNPYTFKNGLEGLYWSRATTNYPIEEELDHEITQKFYGNDCGSNPPPFLGQTDKYFLPKYYVQQNS